MARARAKREKPTETNNEPSAIPAVAETMPSREVTSAVPSPIAQPAEGIEPSFSTLGPTAAGLRAPILTPDPRGIMSASIGQGNGTPRMKLLRSHRFKQMQIHFDRQPDDHHLMKLKHAGWTDRTESEGIWTKQVQSGEWKLVVDAERLFTQIANDIRKEQGLEPVTLGQVIA